MRGGVGVWDWRSPDGWAGWVFGFTGVFHLQAAVYIYASCNKSFWVGIIIIYDDRWGMREVGGRGWTF